MGDWVVTPGTAPVSVPEKVTVVAPSVTVARLEVTVRFVWAWLMPTGTVSEPAV